MSKHDGIVYDESKKIPEVNCFDFVPYVIISENERKRIDSGPKIDPDFHCTIYNKKTERSTESDLLSPVGKKCTCCSFEFDGEEELTSDYYETKLSRYLDNDKQNKIKYFIVLHRIGEFSIKFDIKQGNMKATDSDGYIDVNVSPSNLSGVKASSVPSKGGKDFFYKNSLILNLEVTNKESFVCDLNFISEDNDKDNTFDWAGKIKEKVKCGEIGLLLYKCICADWPIISSVIPTDDFVGWATNNVRNCLQLAIMQIAKKDYLLADNGYQENSSNLFQIYKDANNDKINDLIGDSQKKRFKECIEYIKGALNDGIPVIAGVDNKKGHPNNGDLTTDHFVTIVGSGKDSKGCYFLFYDNAVAYSAQGTSDKNRFYVDCRNFTMAVDYTANDYTMDVYRIGKYTKHIVTQVRKSKEK